MDCEWKVTRMCAIGEHFKAQLEGVEGEISFFFFKMGNSCIYMLKRDCQWREHNTSWHYCLNKSFVKEGVVL